LIYYPGSHWLPQPFAGQVYNEEAAAAVVKRLSDAGIGPQTATIKRGQAVIWAASLVHGGAGITDPALTRLSQVTHYYFRGCSYMSPLASDAAGGKTFWREPYDIGARRFVRNSGQGEVPGLKYRLGQRLRLWARRPYME
jgi:hypothetical protein